MATHDGGSKLDRLEAMDEQTKGQPPTIISETGGGDPTYVDCAPDGGLDARAATTPGSTSFHVSTFRRVPTSRSLQTPWTHHSSARLKSIPPAASLISLATSFGSTPRSTRTVRQEGTSVRAKARREGEMLRRLVEGDQM